MRIPRESFRIHHLQRTTTHNFNNRPAAHEYELYSPIKRQLSQVFRELVFLVLFEEVEPIHGFQVAAKALGVW